MFSRPGTEDTESDLLRFQEEFLAGRLNPSATVVRSNSEGESPPAFAGEKRVSPSGPQVERDVVTLEGLPTLQPSNQADPGFPPKKKSRFKARHQNKGQDDKEDIDCAELLDVHDRHVTSVLSQIKEREIQYESIRVPEVSERGFPVALHRGNITVQKPLSSKGTNSEGRKSLFAQQFAASGGTTFGVKEHKRDKSQLKTKASKTLKINSPGATQFAKSSFLSGEGLLLSGSDKMFSNEEVEEIHKENVSKLESMTHEEIMEEQAQIKFSIDPSLVAFLTSRQKKSKTERTDISTEESNGDELYENSTSCAMDIESNHHDGKHVHFSENVEIIKPDNKEEITSDHSTGGCITIGDLKVSSKWLHMDTVETEKLEWMKDCQTPSAVESKEGRQARFDFNGHLVNKSDYIPEYLGLHHHGDDPSSAGYTLEELFVLARSSFLQQRVFALQVLARIMRQDQLGAFQEDLDDNTVFVLLDAGVLFLLRWALDDSSDAVIAAAIQGFAAILIVPSDKELADKMFSFPHGHELPVLKPVTEKEQKRPSKDDEEEKGLTDAELLKQDVVKGLIQMTILPRLRYILEVCHPAVPAVQDILDILTRICQHSTQIANKVLQCPRLVEVIFVNFLPLSWKMSEIKNGSVNGQPISAAMRFVRAVCCAGRHMAATLISKYNLLDRIMRYTALTPGNMQVELQEAYSLYIESLRTWRVCVLYGLGCDSVREMYSTFIEHLQSVQSLSILVTALGEKAELSCATAIFGIIEAATHAASTSADHKAQGNISTTEEHHGIDSPPPLALNWSHVTGFLPLIGGCVTKWVKEIVDSDTTSLQPENLCLLSGSLAILTAFCTKPLDQDTRSPVETLQELEQLINTVLLPLVNSEFLDSCFTQISLSHNSRSSKPSGKAIFSLPGYGPSELSCNAGKPSTKLDIHEFIGFISSLLQLMYQVTKLHKGMVAKFSAVLHKEAVLEYLMLAVESRDDELSFFSRQEHHLQYFLLKLASNVFDVTESEDLISRVPLWHEVGLRLFAKFLPGDEFYALDLLSSVLFNSKFFRVPTNEPSSLNVIRDLSDMSLASPPQSTTYDTSTASRGELVAEAHNNLPYIRSVFVDSLQGKKRALDVSRSLSLHQVRNTPSFLVSPCTGSIHPADWMFLPIVKLHNQAISVEMKGREIDTVTGPAVSIVTATLQLVLMLEDWRPSCLRHVSMTSRIARLLCIFLTGSDLFLKSKVHDYLSALLRIYTNSTKLAKLDFNSPIPGLTSFYDLYASLLLQYSAVSFGDSLFGCFVILPLTQRHDIKFRRAVWDEHIGVLRVLAIPLDQLPIPLDEFLYPIEQNQSLLTLYLRALATQTMRAQWSPLFYLVALHHVNAFVFQRVNPEDDRGLKQKITILKQVLAVQNENVRHDILHYYKPTPSDSSQLFEKFTSLPADRQLLLRNQDNLEDCRKIYQKIASV